MVEGIQKYKDYPCYICGKLRNFVSTLSPVGNWVCTACGYTTGDDMMKKWGKVKIKLGNNGVRFVLGMKIKYPFRRKL